MALVLVSMLLTLPALSEDTVLLWMLEDPVINGVNGADPTDLATMFATMGDSGPNAIRICAIDSSGAIMPQNYTVPDAPLIPPQVYMLIPDDFDNWYAGPLQSVVSGMEGYSFMIEIGNLNGNDWTVLAVSEQATYAKLEEDGHMWSGGGMPAEDLAWSGGSYVVPEPSSGVLMLLGFGLAALRRRRDLMKTA